MFGDGRTQERRGRTNFTNFSSMHNQKGGGGSKPKPGDLDLAFSLFFIFVCVPQRWVAPGGLTCPILDSLEHVCLAGQALTIETIERFLCHPREASSRVILRPVREHKFGFCDFTMKYKEIIFENVHRCSQGTQPQNKSAEIYCGCTHFQWNSHRECTCFAPDIKKWHRAGPHGLHRNLSNAETIDLRWLHGWALRQSPTHKVWLLRERHGHWVALWVHQCCTCLSASLEWTFCEGHTACEIFRSAKNVLSLTPE